MHLFGNRLLQLAKDLFGFDIEEFDAYLPQLRTRQPDPRYRAIMQIVVSLVVLGAGFYVLATGSDTAGQAAAGAIGAVVGYWLS